MCTKGKGFTAADESRNDSKKFKNNARKFREKQIEFSSDIDLIQVQ